MQNSEYDVCIGKVNWDKGGKFGKYYGKFCVNGMWWAVVLWDDEEDPDLYKYDGIII